MSSAPKPVVPSLNGWSPSYLDEQYAVYQRDPGAVSPELFAFFRGFDLAQAGDLRLDGQGPASPPASAAGLGGTPASRASSDGSRFSGVAAITPAAGRPAGRTSHFQAVVDDLIGAYRAHGHLVAQIDPLGAPRERPEDLTLAYHQLSDADLDRPVDGSRLGLGDAVPLRDVVEWLERVYCGSIGFEVMHIQDTAQRAWLLERFESINGHLELDRGSKAHLLELLTKSELFERFLGRRYPGEKRFSLEGAESLIPLLDHMLEGASGLGVEEVVVGMAHRGRLNVLNNILGKTYEQIFTEFEEAWAEDFVDGGGDVKYHRGYSGTRRYRTGRMLHLAMASNPSHLEAVNGVVQGRCRAKQRLRGDTDRDRVIPVLMHGDAALAGQGTVQEILNFSQLEGYTTGGTLHVVINNQIGFTTNPRFSRSSPYPSDVAKMIEAPIFHVNGDDPEAVTFAAKIAIEYRMKFFKPVVIDMICYRRFGHNEGDEPMFTNPIMYKKIKKQKTTLQLYTERLVRDGLIPEGEIEDAKASFQARLNDEFEAGKTFKPNKADWLDGRWSHLDRNNGDYQRGETSIKPETLAEIGASLTRAPDGVALHKTVARLLEAKAKMFETGEGFDWATGEALAFGSLLTEGYPVRLSGQDSTRGTFSPRHSALIDQNTEERYYPLNQIRAGQARFEVIDSMLSEYAVLGFEYGYSLAEPNALTMWEAQFGDFANGAQIMFDQFISSGERKWLRMSGLVMLLPHGFEGQGPEHSSARLERFLQMSAEDNWIVANCTTPANYFHILRRQLHRDFRKPLVLLTPKSLLRHKLAVSRAEDFTTGSSFHRVLWDDAQYGNSDTKLKPDAKIKRVVICSGKVYFDLLEERDARGIDDVYLMRLEQFHPFPALSMVKELERFKKAEIIWCQEEPKNQGAWSYVEPNLEWVLSRIGAAHGRPKYAGRAASASPATGLASQHKAQQQALVNDALTIEGK